MATIAFLALARRYQECYLIPTMEEPQKQFNPPSFATVTKDPAQEEEFSILESPVTPFDPCQWAYTSDVTPPRPDSPSNHVPVGAAKVPNKTLPSGAF